MSKINALLITGPSCSGQTTLAGLLNQLLDTRQGTGIVQVIDSRDIVNWGRRLRTPLGEKVRQLMPAAPAGQNLPDSIFVQLFAIWLEDVRIQNTRLRLLLASGFPRSVEQLTLLHEFSKSIIVHIEATADETLDVMKQRLVESPAHVEKQTDDAANEFHQELRDYVNRTRPALARLNGIVAKIRRGDPLVGRLHKTLQYLREHPSSPVQSSMIEGALRRLRTDTHPIHRAIRDIERPKRLLDMSRGLNAQVHV